MRLAGSGRASRRGGIGRAVAVLLVLVCAACGASGASSPTPSAPVSGLAPTTDVTGAADPAGGGSSAAWAGMLPALLGAPKKPPVDPLALLAFLLQPWREPYKTGPNPGSPVVTAPFALPEGDGTVYAVGDSVLLGTRDYLPGAIGGWDLRLDARVGRTMPEGLDIIDHNRASIGQAMIIGLGHNYGGGGKFVAYLDQLLAMAPKAQRIVIMTVAEWSPAQVEVNRAIRALPKLYSSVVVADWQAVVAANPQFLSSDHVHPTRAGSIALANLLAVMLGPAKPNGRTVPPPTIRAIPDDGPSSPSGPTTSAVTTTSTSTTTTSVPGSTTTTTAATTSTTTGPTTTTTAAEP